MEWNKETHTGIGRERGKKKDAKISSIIDNMQAAATTAVATTVAAAALLSMAYLFFIQSIKWNPHSFHQHISGIQIAWIPFYSKWEFFFAFFQTFACPLSLTVCIAYGLHIQLKYQKNIFIYNRNFRLFAKGQKAVWERKNVEIGNAT